MTTLVYIFDSAVLTGVAAAQGTAVGSLTRRVIKSASLTNTTAAAVACSVYLVASGSASAGNTFISARAVAAGETYNCPELIGKGLNAGGTVQALGAGVSFAYTASEIV